MKNTDCKKKEECLKIIFAFKVKQKDSKHISVLIENDFLKPNEVKIYRRWSALYVVTVFELKKSYSMERATLLYKGIPVMQKRFHPIFLTPQHILDIKWQFSYSQKPKTYCRKCLKIFQRGYTEEETLLAIAKWML